ncbi:replicative DNA helicase [Streptomyces vietnamensis]|uniref:replicative DNA helicase n=1 Tax=Streptomyces vietnamensis TaxID=362257 RepID=UPI0037A57E46
MAEEQQQTDVHDLSSVLELALDRTEATATKAANGNGFGSGLPTGFKDVDALTGGLTDGALMVIAARPAMGRSTLLMDICRHVSLMHVVPTLHVSLEHTIAETSLRLTSSECRIALHRLRSGTMDATDWDRLAKRLPKISEAPLHFWAPARLTAGQLAVRAHSEVEERGIKLIAVDGIQDIRPEKRNELREREVGDVVRDLKTLARELDIPIVATSHLNRAPEARRDRVPMLDDLRESGAITYAADTIILLHRPDAYVKESPRAGEADLIFAKHRDGPTAVVTVAFQGHYSRFVDMART